MIKKCTLGACILLLGSSQQAFASQKNVSTQADLFNEAIAHDDEEKIRSMLNLKIIDEELDTHKTYTKLVTDLKKYAAGEITRNQLLMHFLTTFYNNKKTETLIKIAGFVPKSGDQSSLLHEAIKNKAPSEIIIILIHFGADPIFVRNQNGNSAIALSIILGNFNCFLPIMASHLYNKVNFFAQKIDVKGNTILTLSIQQVPFKENEKLFFFILAQSHQQRALNIKNNAGYSSLDYIYGKNLIPLIAHSITLGVRTVNRHSELFDINKYFSRSKLNVFIENHKDVFLNRKNAFPEEPDMQAQPCIKFKELNDALKKRQIVEAKSRVSYITPKLLEELIKHQPSLLKEKNIPYNPDYSTYSIRPDNIVWPTGGLLHEACYWGWIELVKIIIENGGDVTMQDSWGNTPLHIAIQRGNEELTAYLLTQNAPLNKKNCNKESPLHVAVNKSWMQAIEAILSRLPPLKKISAINFKLDINKETVFSKACKSGNLPLIKLLIKHGALINYTANGALAPIFHALNQEQWNVVTFLLSHDDIDLFIKDTYGLTLLHHLCLGNNIPTEKLKEWGELLAQRGALLNTIYTSASTSQDFSNGTKRCLNEYAVFENAKKCLNKCAYQIALENGVTPLVKLFDQQFKQQNSMQKKSTDGFNNTGGINSFKKQ